LGDVPVLAELAGEVAPGSAEGEHRRPGQEMVERLLLDRVDAEARGASVGGEHDLVVLAGAHVAESALAVMETAIARAEVALNAAGRALVPVAARAAGKELIHIGTDLARVWIILDIWASRGGEAMRTASELPGVRPAAVAGSFYPGDPGRLRAQVDELLGGAPGGQDVPKALIAPHAGYVYSGGVAAAAFATLRTRAETIERAVVIGPAHYVRLRGLAVPTAAAFETPLGRVPVDQEALAAIADLPFVSEADDPHAPEHALEVELPFLQRILPSFALVPLVVGEARPDEVAEVLARLWGGPETVLVISSDLSHYHRYAEPQRLDLEPAAPRPPPACPPP